MKRKKTYRSPSIELVNIDREFVLLLNSTTEETGPGHDGPEELGAPQGTEHLDSFNKNNLNNNPFEK